MAAPPAAAHDMLGAGSRALWINSQRFGLIILPVPIRTPFENIAKHVVHAKTVRTFLTDRMGIRLTHILGVLPIPGVVLQASVVIAKAKDCVRTAATGILPLRFRRQAIPATFLLAQATAILARVFPTDVARGVVWIFLGPGTTFPRCGAHRLGELILRDFGGRHVKTTRQTDSVREKLPVKLLLSIDLLGDFGGTHIAAHHKFPGRDPNQLHPYAVGKGLAVLRLLLELRIKKVRHLFDDLRLRFLAFGKTVVAALGDIERRRDARFQKCRVQQFTLVQRHDKIRVAVDDETGRVVFGDVGDRIRLPAFLGCLFNRLAD